jgi:hypothetical protein
MAVFFCCGCAATVSTHAVLPQNENRRYIAATVFVHAALPHKNTSLRLCRKTKTEKRCILIQPHCDYGGFYRLYLVVNKRL